MQWLHTCVYQAHLHSAVNAASAVNCKDDLFNFNSYDFIDLRHMGEQSLTDKATQYNIQYNTIQYNTIRVPCIVNRCFIHEYWIILRKIFFFWPTSKYQYGMLSIFLGC